MLAGDRGDHPETVAAELPPHRTIIQRTDVSRYGDVDALVNAAVERSCALHVMVNNAGVAPGGSVVETRRDDWERTMAVNAGGVFHGLRAAMPHLVASKGCIVNMVSVSGIGGDWALGATTRRRERSSA